MGHSFAFDEQTFSIAVLVARLVFGLLMAAHGVQKLFGWFGGHGLRNTGEFLGQLGFRPGRAFALSAGLGEFLGGLLTAIGLAGPVGPAIMIAVMLVAAISVHWANGLFATQNGIELPLLYATVAFGIGVAGHGRFSLDGALGFASVWTTTTTGVVLLVGVTGGVANLMLRSGRAEKNG